MTPWTATFLTLLALSSISPRLHAAEGSVAPVSVRLSEDGRSLQTAVRTYRHPARASVTLLATVHVASSDYFAQIAMRVREFNCVLVEGVRRTQVAPPVATYDYAASLGLTQQSSALDLRLTSNVINADLDGASFDQVRHESGQATPAVKAPTSRRALADGLLTLTTDPAALAATEVAYAIRARHNVVLRALRHSLARGDASIALVYGVAHGPDLHTRLLKLGFVEQSTAWVDAFTLD